MSGTLTNEGGYTDGEWSRRACPHGFATRHACDDCMPSQPKDDDDPR